MDELAMLLLSARGEGEIKLYGGGNFVYFFEIFSSDTKMTGNKHNLGISP